jgi:hypothetical protein
MENSGRDGELIVPHGSDYVGLEILAPVFAARLSVHDSHFAAKTNRVDGAHLHVVIQGIPAGGRDRGIEVLRSNWVKRRKKIRRRLHPAEGSREKEKLTIRERERLKVRVGAIQGEAVGLDLLRGLRLLSREGEAETEKSSYGEECPLRPLKPWDRQLNVLT